MSENREFFRKKVSAPAFLVQASGEVEFQIRDLSLDGFQGQFDSVPDLKEGSLVYIRLPALELERKASVVRITPCAEGGAQIGFLFVEGAGQAPAFPSFPSDLAEDDDLRF
jgi:hypothetical protein